MSDTKLFPGAVIQMIKVGENTGTLNEQLTVVPNTTAKSSSTRSNA
jgi:type II secretory pathway component PulF